MNQDELTALAAGGDRQAFDRLVAPHLSAIKSLALRMVMQPDDAADLVQDALLQAFQSLGAFRGDSTFRTWLFTITTRKCIDHLRARKRWPVSAQTQAAGEHVASPELMAKLAEVASSPGFTYEQREHVAYCFACIAKTLPPEDAAALWLRDIYELTHQEAAQAVGVTTSVLRHRLARSRQTMSETFEGLCALVSKQGMCWQCSELRDALPEAGRGAPIEPIAAHESSPDEKLDRRLKMVRSAELGTGQERTRPLHDYIIRYMSRAFD